MMLEHIVVNETVVYRSDPINMSQHTMSMANGNVKPLRRVLSSSARSTRSNVVPGVVVGTLTGINADRQPLVDFAENPNHERAPVPARTTIHVAESDVGRPAVIAFELNDRCKPILLGLIDTTSANTEKVVAESLPANREIVSDGEKLVLNADREIVLRCGESSITLTRAGKIIIRGAYLLSRSSGVNSIKGGTVQIN